MHTYSVNTKLARAFESVLHLHLPSSQPVPPSSCYVRFSLVLVHGVVEGHFEYTHGTIRKSQVPVVTVVVVPASCLLLFSLGLLWVLEIENKKTQQQQQQTISRHISHYVVMQGECLPAPGM